MAIPTGTHFVISASLTSTGAPTYRDANGAWVTDLKQAHPAADEAERDRMLEASQLEEHEVCDPYPFAVCVEDGGIVLLTAREKIRATGPTVPVRRPDSTSPN
jgi:hypothetical protein